MTKFELIESTRFGEIETDIYSDQNDMFMTTKQLGECLGYSEPVIAINKLINRKENIYIKTSEFSVITRLVSTDGKTYRTRVFNEDGIYEITFLAKTERAKEFRRWVRGILKQLRSGKLMLTDGNIALTPAVIENTIQKLLGASLLDISEIKNQMSVLTEQFRQIAKTQDFMGRTLYNAFYTPTEQSEWKREIYKRIRNTDPNNPDPRWNISPVLHELYPIVFDTLGIDQEAAKTEYKERNNTEKFISTIDVIAERDDMRKVFESLVEDYVAECLNRKDMPYDVTILIDIFKEDN